MDDSPLNAFLSLPAWLVTGLFLLAIAGYFQFKSGSSYALMNRLYALLIGGSEFSDRKLKKFWQERTDIERFNALFHMQTKSLKEIHWIQQRVQKNELNIKFFSKMRGGFDSQLRKVKKINPWITVFPGVVFLGIALSIQPLLFIASSNGAIVKLKNESQWVSLNKNGFSSISYLIILEESKEWAFDKSACESLGQVGVVNTTGLSIESVKIICSSFEDPESIAYFNQTIKDQKIFWYIGTLYFFVAILISRLLISMIHTIKARPQLYEALIKARRDRILRSGSIKQSNSPINEQIENSPQLEEATN
ncbi:DUF6216 family protein [Amphritea japonica]|uniref:Uncharacterized protein n=1 Tax=Amphritea japonica ATCC BAA-1530 TaxID=1278309 RepID=A0A7R6SQW9_9GAMM|nr:DUF6216 family protein [Amphritea japonica]BBB24614.1 conserved hypothetical protein [Amphritea japonica ATCC BAA-1530]